MTDFFDYFGDDNGKTLCNFYGSTEMMDSTYCAFRSGDDASRLRLEGKVPIGRPVANTAAYVLDADMAPVGSGEVGELYIASNNLALGYAGENQGGIYGASLAIYTNESQS